MTTLTILFAFVGAGDEASSRDVIRAWQEREAENPVFDLSWKIVRDSRSPEWSETPRSTKSPVWRLRADRGNYRLDGWQPILGLSDPRPDGAAADRERTKTEFIAYLQSGFADPARVPATQKLAILLRPTGFLPDGLGEGDRLLIGASLIAQRPFSNPLFKLSAKKLTVLPRTVSTPDGELTVLCESPSNIPGWEIWADSKHRDRPVRMFVTTNGIVTRQVDFEYDAESPETPLRWTVVLHNPVSRLTSYSTAERTALDRTPLDPGIFEIEKPQIATAPIVQESTGALVRRSIRSVLNHAMLPFVLIALPIGLIVWRLSAGSRPGTRPSGPDSTLSANELRGGLAQNQQTHKVENDPISD